MLDLRQGDIVFGNTDDTKYEITRFIGNGQFGIVYEASDDLGRKFAVKTVLTAGLDDQAISVLVNEGKLATQIKHENVIEVLFFHDGIQYSSLPPYMLMEYADEGNLEKLLKTRRHNSDLFTLEQIKNTFLQLCSGMKAINEKLVHRDIKPDNILVNQGIYKITDFGLSKVVGLATRSQTFKGINHIKYCAPEAWHLGRNELGMDIYSMGIVFYEIATLQFPYSVEISGDFIDDWKKAHLIQMPNDPKEYNPSLPIELSQIILEMMSKRASDRYSSWDQIIERLDMSSVSTNTERDVSQLIERAVEIHTKKEQERLLKEENARNARERANIVDYCFSEIRDHAINLVETFNRYSEFAKLKLFKNSQRFEFSICPAQSSAHGVKVSVHPLNENVQFKEYLVKAWGVVMAPSGKGFNILLVAEDADEVYGKWITFHVRHNPIAKRKDKRLEPFPFNLDEIAKEIELISGMHIYVVDQSIFDPKMFDPLVDELLEK